MNKIQAEDFIASYWHKLDNGKIQCDLCPQCCKLTDGQHGLCYARMRKGDKLISLVYGQASSFAIDPVEKKPLYHFMPDSRVFSFGTIGCNLFCKFCQNWQISRATNTDYLIAAPPHAIVAEAVKTNCQSIAFTYNEPTISIEYVIDTAKEAHKNNLKTIAVTAGFICKKPRQDLYAHIDAANVDLKFFNDDLYRKISGARLQPILDTILYLRHQTNVWLEVTNLLIPGLNDSEQEIDALSKWIYDKLGTDVPLHFTAFYPCYKMSDRQSTPEKTLVRARDIALKNGLNYVYVGNILNYEGNSTYCHNCKKLIIERSGFTILTINLDSHGHCKFCNTKCAGHF